jgi:hypothetical protein
MEELVHKLQELDDNIDYANCGGCGVIAYAVSKWLRKRKVYHTITVGYRSWCKEAYELNSTLLLNENKIKAAPSHVVITIDGTHYDSEGQVSLEEYDWVQQNITAKNLLAAINNKDMNSEYGWNDTFERSKCIPVIEKILSINLREINRKHA